MKKIYMAGVGGMLGEAFYEQFKNEYELLCSDIDDNEDWLVKLDFRNEEKYIKAVTDFNPDFLFHIGAYTDLEYCELHEKDTYDTNTKSVEYAVKIANNLNIPLLYISTAGIFDGEKDVYDESDQPKPLGHYGKSKYLGEVYVQENSKDYIICRAGWMMGAGAKKDKKFIQKLIRQITDGVRMLHIVNDKLGTPTYTHDFANNVKLLIEKEHNYTPEWIKGGDLMYNNDKIEVKTFTSSGPSSFGPKESWKTIYFLDATKFLQNYYICYEVNLQNDDEKWKNIKVNKKQTFHDQCAQKRRPRISFSKILPQLDKSDVKKIYDGNIMDIIQQ